MDWDLRVFEWHTNRLLIHMVPGDYYATYLIWDDASDEFKDYYINFQTPFQRSPIGFDTLDLELDIVINPDFSWSYKDEDNYFLGLREGCITESQNSAVENAKNDIFAMIDGRHYPLDGSLVDWCPDPTWKPARLPAEWKRMKSDGRQKPSFEKVKGDKNRRSHQNAQ
jgi:predicted RNA-binding protein associated with RNAse of E/G family